jgi:hypothetical protein
MSLTVEDKQWFTSQLERTEERLAAVERAQERLAGEVVRVEGRLAGEIIRVDERLTARIEHVETALLTEFHKWASPLEMRMRTHSAVLRAMDLEIEAATDRIPKLDTGQSENDAA